MAASLTAYVADFIHGTRFGDIPGDVVELGKKSILDGFGLALSGNFAASGAIVRAHLESLGLAPGPALVIGSGLRIAPRFAAFANGVAIHADDYDDTQLAEAKDRVYGLLTHPTAPCLPAALAIRDPEAAFHFRNPSPEGTEFVLKMMEGVLPAAEHYLDSIVEEAETEARRVASNPEPLLNLVRNTRRLSA